MNNNFSGKGFGFRFGGEKNSNNQNRNKRNKGGGFGPDGYCVCAKCGEKIPHQRGVKCTSIKCPKCGHTMVREEFLNK